MRAAAFLRLWHSLLEYNTILNALTGDLWGVFSGFFGEKIPRDHCSDVIMGAMASQITSPTIVYSTVYSGADQRKHESSASLAFVRGSNAETVSIRWRHYVMRVYCSRKMKMKTSLFFNRNCRYVRDPRNNFVHYFYNSLYREINWYFSRCDEINTRYNEIKTHCNKKTGHCFLSIAK